MSAAVQLGTAFSVFSAQQAAEEALGALRRLGLQDSMGFVTQRSRRCQISFRLLGQGQTAVEVRTDSLFALSAQAVMEQFGARCF
jgi:hypothetical protein